MNNNLTTEEFTILDLLLAKLDRSRHENIKFHMEISEVATRGRNLVKALQQPEPLSLGKAIRKHLG